MDFRAKTGMTELEWIGYHLHLDCYDYQSTCSANNCLRKKSDPTCSATVGQQYNTVSMEPVHASWVRWELGIGKRNQSSVQGLVKMWRVLPARLKSSRLGPMTTL